MTDDPVPRGVRATRLAADDRERARRMFALMADVFDEAGQPLGDTYLDRLLRRDDFWAIAAELDDEMVGGLTAHTLPMTRAEGAEIFIYDIAVMPALQRRGIGRRLLGALRTAAAAAGIHDVFVPADNDDLHALDFYRALGGEAASVTVFSFSDEG
jgi:aminoglycoside 3-N-acetyltransferase I